MEHFVATVLDHLSFIGISWLKILPMDLARYIVGAGGVFLLVNCVFAGKLSGRKIRQDGPTRAQMLREVRTSLRTVGIFTSVSAIFIAGGMAAGFLNIDSTISARGGIYFILNTLALVVLHDSWFYWTHRLIHQPRLFRRWHRIHHKSFNPSPWTAYSFNVGEALINAIYMPIALFVIPTSSQAIVIFLAHMILRNAVGHCGYELFPSWRNGRPIFGWLTTVTHHDLHHSNAGWNFGLYFTWWDRMMGTEHPRYLEKYAAAVGKPLDGSALQAIRAP